MMRTHVSKDWESAVALLKRKVRWVDYKLVCEAGVTIAVEDPNPSSMAGQVPN